MHFIDDFGWSVAQQSILCLGRIKSGIGRIENEFVDLMEKTTNRFAKHAELGWGLVSGDLNVQNHL